MNGIFEYNSCWHYDETWTYTPVGYGALISTTADKGTPLAKRVYTPLTDDTTFTDLIPANYFLEYIVIYNSTANAGQLSMGTTAGGNEVFNAQAIPAGFTTVTVNKAYSVSAATTFYLSDRAGDSWNSMSLTVVFILKKIL